MVPTKNAEAVAASRARAADSANEKSSAQAELHAKEAKRRRLSRFLTKKDTTAPATAKDEVKCIT